jgi:AAA+ ATPase superfamily predicted ATPase
MLNEPAVGKKFFGREDVLAVLNKRLNALKGGYRQNVALTGQMLAGKSSILRQFLYALQDISIIPIYIEVREEPFSAFANKFIASLLYGFLASCGKESEKNIASLVTAAAPLAPHTVHWIKEVRAGISRKRYSEAYKNLLSLTSILKTETGKSCVVILDEFHNLESFRIKKAFLQFGKIIMIQKGTMYIVSSSQKSAIKKILSEKLSLLYGNFEVIEISGFDDKTARAFLKEKLQGLDYPENVLDYLIDFTDGNPFYLDMISKKISGLSASRGQCPAESDLIAEAVTDLVYSASGAISQYFANNALSLFEKRSRSDFMDIMVALACGFNKIPDMAAWFKKKNHAYFSTKLARLIELDLVWKNGVFYDVEDKLFKFWLKNVYYKKKSELVGDPVSGSAEFKKEVSGDMNAYIRECARPATERIKELFGLFNGEMVEIDNKKRRLPRFAKIEIQKYGRRQDLVTYRGSDRYWVCEVWRDKIDEPAVSDFIARYYSMRDKIAKQVCIALDGIDPNALLLAKEKNIWVWGLDSVNRLLRLYKKHGLRQG